MFMFWPVELTHWVAALFGQDISPPKKIVDEQKKEEEDSEDSDDNQWTFNSKMDSKTPAKRPKSPKNGNQPLLTEDEF